MEFFDLVKARRSIRLFQKKKVEKEKLNKILETANQAPSAGNLQAYEIVVVRDEEQKQKLYQAALEQEAILEADIVLIFFANPVRSSFKYGKRGENLYSLQDATVAASYAQLACTNLGLGCVWIGAFDEGRIRKICRASNVLKPVAVIPIGYPAEKPEKTSRRDLKDLVHYEKLD
jgi:nitroreductase